MPLASFLVLVNLAMAIAAVVFLVYAFPFKKFRPVQYLILLNVGFLIFGFCTINVFIVQDYEWKVLFSRLRFVGLSFIGQSFLLLMSKTLNRFMWLHKKAVLIALFAPAAVTIFISIVPSLRDFMVTGFQPFSYYGLDVLTFRGGPWFFVHMLFGYGSIGLAAYLCVDVLVKSKGLRRKQALILFSALLITMVFENFVLITESPLRWVMVTTSLYCINQFALLYCSFLLGWGHLIVLARHRMFELIPDPILVFDYRSRLALMNDAARRAFGFSSSEITKNMSDLISANLMTSGIKTVTHVNGEEFIYDVTERSLSNDPTVPFGNLIYFRNISKQKQVEQRLEDLLQFDANLLSMVSHDLSGNLQNQARLAAGVASKLSNEDKKLGALLEESAFASRDLIHGLVTWAKAQSIDLPSPRKPFELNALIQDSIALLKPLMDAKNLSCETTSLHHAIVIHGDSGMISSVVRNLVTNAINASSGSQKIRIEISRDENSAKFCVVDQGPGISDAVLSAAFGESAVKTPHQTQGYGVGIKLSQKFILAHKGELVIRGAPGEGTRASVSMPLGAAL